MSQLKDIRSNQVHRLPSFFDICVVPGTGLMVWEHRDARSQSLPQGMYGQYKHPDTRSEAVIAQGSVFDKKGPSICLGTGRRDKRGAEVNGWTLWAKAFQAEGRANTKAWSDRRLAIHPPALPATFSFVLSLCLPRAIQSALLNFFHIQSLCITDEKARPGKKRVFPGSIPDLLVLLWGSFPILCVPSLLQTPYHSKSPQRECSSLLN